MPIERFTGHAGRHARYVLEQFGLDSEAEQTGRSLAFSEFQAAFKQGLDGQVPPRKMVERLQMDQLDWRMKAGESGVVFFGLQDVERDGLDDALVTVDLEAVMSVDGNLRIRAIRIVGLEESQTTRLLMGSYDLLKGRAELQSAGISLMGVEVQSILEDKKEMRRLEDSGTRDFDFCDPTDNRYHELRLGVVTRAMHHLAAAPTLCVVTLTMASGMEWESRWPKEVGVGDSLFLICRDTADQERYELDAVSEIPGWNPVPFLPTQFDDSE